MGRANPFTPASAAALSASPYLDGNMLPGEGSKPTTVRRPRTRFCGDVVLMVYRGTPAALAASLIQLCCFNLERGARTASASCSIQTGDAYQLDQEQPADLQTPREDVDELEIAISSVEQIEHAWTMPQQSSCSVDYDAAERKGSYSQDLTCLTTTSKRLAALLLGHWFASLQKM